MTTVDESILELSEKQDAVFDDFFTLDKLIWLLDGGTRSGKTDLAVLLMLVLAADYTGETVVVVGRTAGSAKQNIRPALVRFARVLGIPVNTNATPMRVGGNEWRVFGASKIGDAETIWGASSIGALIDEATRCREDCVKAAQSRCTEGDDPRIVMTMNPASRMHWLRQEYIVPNKGNTYYENFVIWDNPFLPTAIVEEIIEMWSGADYQRLVEGKWADQSGRVLPNLTISDYTPETVLDIDLTVDPGYSDPYAGLIILSTPEGYVIWDEYYETHESVNLNAEEHALAVETQYDAAAEQFNAKNRWCFVDPGAKGDRLEYTKLGFADSKTYNNADTNKGVGCKLLRLQMDRSNYIIHPRCTNLIREAEDFYWDPDAEDMPQDGNDHTIDALRYHCNRAYRNMAAVMF